MKNLLLALFIFLLLSSNSYALSHRDYEASKPKEAQKIKKISKKEKLAKQKLSEEQYILAMSYYNGDNAEKDYEKALSYLEKSASQNNDNAIYKLGKFYEKGYCGVDKDIEKAVELYEKSAAKNNKYAIYSLAYLYYTGEYFDKDYEKALDLFTTAGLLDNKNAMFYIKKIYLADKTNAKALYSLAVLDKKFGYVDSSLIYLQGLIVTEYKDYAIRELKELSESGNSDAQYLLGKLYEEGTSINISINKAIENYELSATQKHTKALNCLRDLAKERYRQAEYAIGSFYHNGINYSKDLNEAIYWYSRAVRQNHKEAVIQLTKANDERNSEVYATLAFTYKDGSEKEKLKAFNYFKKSVKLGNVYSMINLGMCYEKSVGVKQDYKKAFNLYLKAANLGNDAAQFNLAKAYQHGRGVDKNLEEAFKYFEKSAEQNNITAIVDLGVCYEKGEGVEVNMEKAIELYRKAMKENDSYAIFKIAAFHESGEYLNKDPLLALELFKKAALLGNETAIEVLEEYRQAAKNGDREVIKLLDKLRY